MSNQWIAVIYLLTILICVMGLYHIRKSNHYMKRSVQYLICVCCLVTFSYLLTVFSNSYMVMKISHCVYLSLMGWLCATVLYYTYCLSGKIKIPKKFCVLAIVILVIDSILQLLNIWFEFSMQYEVSHENKSLFLVLQQKMPFQLHLIICYLMLGASLLLLIHHIILCAKVFRSQYITTLILLIVLLLAKGAFIYSAFTYDYAIIGFNLASVLLCYYTLNYSGNQIARKMSGMVLKNIPSMVLMFDCQGTLIYKNYSIVTSLIHGKNQKEILKELTIDDSMKNIPIIKEFVNTVSGETIICRIFYKQLFDENMVHQRREIGSCLIVSDITEDRERLNSSVYLANHDLLTGLYNRKYFCESSQQLIIENSNVIFAILMIDIYQFTQYNLCFGSKAGDLVLQKIAYEMITKISDPYIRFGRYEAGRFVLCLPYSYCNESFFKKHHFFDSIQENNYQISLYFGICPISVEDEPLEIVCEHALAAIGTIKGSSSKKIAVYNEKMRNQLLMQNRLISDFPKAMESKAIVAYIQPQINQLTKEIIGGEVLARWIDVDGKIISPGVFIPILENNNLVSKLDYYIWEETCRLIKQAELNGAPVALSVNLSAQDFYHFDIYEVFVKLVEQYQINPEYLRLEITESDVICDINKQLPLIKKLQAKGFLVEMDDFGSGYSSLNTLKDIPVNVLKMDMKFFEDAQKQGRSQTIVRNVIRMAKELELSVIAEGVETLEQAELLKDAGCYLIQGYLYGRPMEASEFFKLFFEDVNNIKSTG